MTKRLIVFVMVWLGALSILPLRHWLTVPSQPSPQATLAEQVRSVFRLDELLSLPAFALFRLGISIDPGNAVTGKSGWLYLGNQHDASLTTLQTGSSPANLPRIQHTITTLTSWQQWLATLRIPMVILIGPNKETIYPEYLPSWLRPAQRSVLDELVTEHSLPVIDLRATLQAHKAEQKESLVYFRTDTHWTNTGAWPGYQALRPAMGIDDTHWLHLDEVKRHPVQQGGGDLARFLRIDSMLSERAEQWEIPERFISHYRDFDTSAAMEHGIPQAGHPMQTLTGSALNAKKVLWLRDSFGNAMVPWMAATFQDTVQWHWREALANPMRLQALIERYQPDFVVLTLVERGLLAGEWHPPRSSHAPSSLAP